MTVRIGTSYALIKSIVQPIRREEMGDTVMCEKFRYYSTAQMFALALDVPVMIVLSNDGLYWVVEKQWESACVQQGTPILAGSC